MCTRQTITHHWNLIMTRLQDLAYVAFLEVPFLPDMLISVSSRSLPVCQLLVLHRNVVVTFPFLCAHGLLLLWLFVSCLVLTFFPYPTKLYAAILVTGSYYVYNHSIGFQLNQNGLHHGKRAIIAYANSNGSGKPLHPCSLPRTYAVQSRKW